MSHSFEVTAGAPGSPVVLHVPHSSTVIPDAERARILLDDDGLAAELRAMTDAHTALVADRAALLAATTPWQFVNGLSRLVVDPERFTDPGLEEMEAVGMGAVYTATHDLRRLRDDDPHHRAELITRHFRPYADALADLVDERLAATGRAVIIDVHSFPTGALPYERHKDLRRPEICLGVDDEHTPDMVLRAARDAFASFDVGVNEPFIGTYVPTRHYGKDPRVSSIMIEIRRDIYLASDGEPMEAGVHALAFALGRLIDAVDR